MNINDVLPAGSLAQLTRKWGYIYKEVRAILGKDAEIGDCIEVTWRLYEEGKKLGLDVPPSSEPPSEADKAELEKHKEKIHGMWSIDQLGPELVAIKSLDRKLYFALRGSIVKQACRAIQKTGDLARLNEWLAAANQWHDSKWITQQDCERILTEVNLSRKAN